MKKVLVLQSSRVAGYIVDDRSLLQAIRGVIQQARGQVRYAVNRAMVEAYWHVSRLIIEDEQPGSCRKLHSPGLLKAPSCLVAKYQHQKVFKVKRVNIRMTEWDVEKAQALAMRQGIPYATLLTSILHKHLKAA